MQIISQLETRAGQVCRVVYRDADTPADLHGQRVSSVHGFCFCGGKLVVVFSAAKGYWAPPGGAVEQNENADEALIREVREETNMKVVTQWLIGSQEVFEPVGTVTQARYACLVEPLGPFERDPGGDVTEIKLIDPAEYKKYFDWGRVGERLMERARACILTK